MSYRKKGKGRRRKDIGGGGKEECRQVKGGIHRRNEGGRDGGKNEGGRQKKEGRRDADMRGVNSRKNEGKRRG